MSKTLAAVGNARYCLERAAAEWLPHREGETVRERLAGYDDAQLASLIAQVVEKKCQTAMPRLQQHLQVLLEAGPKEAE